MIILKESTNSEFTNLSKLSVKEEQCGFVASVEKSYELAKKSVDKTKSLVIYDDSILIGYTLIRYNLDHSSCFIWQFLIDEKYQGKGYGKKALLELVRLFKSEHITIVSTTIMEGNLVMKHILLKLGFITFCDEDGEIDLKLEL